MSKAAAIQFVAAFWLSGGQIDIEFAITYIESSYPPAVRTLHLCGIEHYLLMMKIDMGAGRGGPSGCHNSYQKQAFDISFF